MRALFLFMCLCLSGTAFAESIQCKTYYAGFNGMTLKPSEGKPHVLVGSISGYDAVVEIGYLEGKAYHLNMSLMRRDEQGSYRGTFNGFYLTGAEFEYFSLYLVEGRQMMLRCEVRI